MDAVIVDCATCGAALKNEYAHLLRDLRQLGVRQLTVGPLLSNFHLLQRAEFALTLPLEIPSGRVFVTVDDALYNRVTRGKEWLELKRLFLFGYCGIT